MDNVALTSCHYPNSAFELERWNSSQSTLPQLKGREPPAAITARSTDNDPDHISYSTTMQFRPSGSQRKGKTPVHSYVPISYLQLPLFAQLQLQRLRREKEERITELHRMNDQHVSNTRLLQKTTTVVQNTVHTVSTENTHLSDTVSL